MQTPWYPGQTYTSLDPLSTNYFTGGQMGYMPNAQYLTEPQYGAFRTPQMLQQHPTSYNYPSLFQSWMTSLRGDDKSGFFRFLGETFAHSPMGANQLRYQAEATRRTQDAWSSAKGALGDVAVQSLFAAGGTALLGPIGGILGGMIAPSVGAMITNRTRTARQLQDLTAPLIVSGRDVNQATGQGLNLSAAANLTSFLHKESASDAFFNLDDYKKFTALAAKTGAFDYGNSVDQYKSTLKKVRKDMMVLMDIFESADPEDVFKQLQRLQVSGAGKSESLGVASKERMYSTMLGMGHQQMINSYGQSGALMYNQMGRTGYLGELANVSNAANIKMMQRLGLISEAELNRMGGIEGAPQRMTQEVHGKAFGDIMNIAGAYLWSGDKEGGLDKEKLEKFKTGNFDITDLLQSMTNMPQSKILQYQSMQDVIKHNIESGVGEAGVLKSVYTMGVKLADRSSLRNEDEQTKALFGMQMLGVGAPLARKIATSMNDQGWLGAQKENEEKELEKRLASINKKYEEQEHLWNKMAVKFKEALNMFDELSLTGLSVRAKWLEAQRNEDRANKKENATVFDKDKGIGFTRGTPDTTRREGTKKQLEKQGFSAPAPEAPKTYNTVPGGGMYDMLTPHNDIPAPHIPIDTNKPDWQRERYTTVPKPKQAQKYPSAFKLKGSKATYDGRYDEYVEEAAKKFNVDPKMLLAIMRQESGFDPTAINEKSGASGLMQIMPSNFAGLQKNYGIAISEKNKLDPKTNIMAGAAIWAEALRFAKGDIKKAIGYYNNGFKGLDWENGRQETRDYVPIVLDNYRQLQQTDTVMPQKAQDFAKSDGATDSTGNTDWYKWSHQWKLFTPEIMKQVRDYTEQSEYSRYRTAATASKGTLVQGSDKFNAEMNSYGIDSELVLKGLSSIDDINQFKPDTLKYFISDKIQSAHYKKYGKYPTASEEKKYADVGARLANDSDVLSYVLTEALGSNKSLRKSYVAWGNRVKAGYNYVMNQKQEDFSRETDKLMKDIAPGVSGATGDDLTDAINKNVELLKAYQVVSVGEKVNTEKKYGRSTDEYSSQLSTLMPSDFKLEADGTLNMDKFKEYLKTKGYDAEAIDKIIAMGRAKKESLKSGKDVSAFLTKSNEAYNRKIEESAYSEGRGFADLMHYSGITPEMLQDPGKLKEFVNKNPDNTLASSMYESISNGTFDMPTFVKENSQKLRDFTKKMAMEDSVAPEAQKEIDSGRQGLRDELVQSLNNLNKSVKALNEKINVDTQTNRETESKRLSRLNNGVVSKAPEKIRGL